jgi:RHS repeat-associated protein
MTTIGTSTPSYDANGNVLNDFLHTYTWDVDGRPLTIDGIGATYDALGRMVELNRSGTYTEIAYTPSGDKLALMSGQSLLRAFVPLPGGATAVYTSGGLDHYRHADWLGSARLETTPSRTVYGDVAYAPYGETYAASGTTDFSWTGINADVEPANPETLYDFPAREYGIQGRWPSPDPAGLDAVDPANPQSWNRYAYVENDPIDLTDPTGLCPSDGPLWIHPRGWPPGIDRTVCTDVAPHYGFGAYTIDIVGWVASDAEGLYQGWSFYVTPEGGGGGSRDTGGGGGRPQTPAFKKSYLPSNAQTCSAIL